METALAARALVLKFSKISKIVHFAEQGIKKSSIVFTWWRQA